jgi:hypothetical protein
MTKQKTFKRRVRERMEKTGESYVSARAALIGDEPPGVHRETAALRFALADAGIEVSEPLALIVAGGAGAATMSFRYEAEDFTRFHLSGWNPFQSDIRAAVERLQLTPDVHETTGARTAERVLRERLEERVQIAWVEDYSVIAVIALDGDRARIYDRTPQTIPAAELAQRRAAIRRQRHRLLAIEPGEPDVDAAVRAGLHACAAGAVNPPSPGMSLDGLKRWADDLERGWPKFPAGPHRENALAAMAAAIAASGGGLLRHLHAKGLHEAAEALDLEALHEVARQTSKLGERWDALAAHTDLGTLAEHVRAIHQDEVATRENLKALLL